MRDVREFKFENNMQDTRKGTYRVVGDSGKVSRMGDLGRDRGYSNSSPR